MAENLKIKQIKIGSTVYDIRDGSVSGQISTAITNLNLGTAAQANTTDFDAAGAASNAFQDAKEYIDGLVSTPINFKGTKDTIAEIKALTSAKAGDLWIALEDNSEWICKEPITTATAAAWEKLGTTDVKGALYKDPASGAYANAGILIANGTDGKVKTVTANASAVGLGNVTNNKQIKGLGSGTTENNILVWGTDGYTVKDSGKKTTDFDPAGAASTAEQNAKDYADRTIVTSSGAHSHSVTASGSYTPDLTLTTKYLSASASGGSVTLGGTTTFLTGATLTTKKLTKQTIAANTFISGVSQANSSTSSFSAHAASYDSTNECLVLTPASNTFVTAVGAVTATKYDSAITYATGAISDSGTGADVGTSISTESGTVSIGTFTQPTISLTANAESATGRLQYLQTAAGKAKDVSVTGTASSANSAHTHTLGKSSS